MLVRKVEDELLQRLKTGKYAAGEKLPSIREMCAEFNCSYVIAFRAVQSLKNAGCLETFKGSGTFVARDVQKRLDKKLLAYIFDKPGNTRLDLYSAKPFAQADINGLLKVGRIEQTFSTKKNEQFTQKRFV